MSSSRRTEVTVDVLIGNVNFSGGRVRIPADVDGGGGSGGTGGGNSGSGGGGGRGGAGQMAGQIAGIFGLRGLQYQLGSLEGLMGALAGLSVEVVGIIALATLAVVGFFATWKALMGIAEATWNVAKSVLVALWQGVVKAGDGFAELGKSILEGSMQALLAFGQAVATVMEQVAEQIARTIQQAVTDFVELEQAVASTVAVMGKFGEAGLQVRDRVMDMAIAMSSRSRFSAIELAQSMQEVSKAGYETVTALWNVTNAGRTLAEAALEPVKNSTELLIKTLNQFQLPVEQAMRVTNVLAAAANKSLASIDSLGKALEYAGPSASMYGMKLEETVAALMGMFQMGARGSMAGTQLTNMFNGLIKQTDKARAAFSAYGLDLSKISPTRMGIIEIVQWFERLQQRIGKGAMLELLGKSFELRALRGFNMLLTVGSQKLREMQASITGTTDAAQMQADQLNTLQGAWKIITNVWNNFEMMVVRGEFATAIRWVVSALQGMVDEAARLGIIKQLGGVLASLTYILYNLVTALRGPLLKAVQEVLGGLPQYVEKIAASVNLVLPSLTQFIGQLPKIIRDALAGLFPALLGFVETLVPLVLQFAQMALPLLASILTAFINVLTQFLSQNGSDLITWFQAVLQAVLSLALFLPSLLPSVRELVQAFVELAPQLLRAAVEGLPALLAAAQQLLPVLITLATNGVGVLLLVMGWLRANLVSQIIPMFKQFLGIVVQILRFIITNWPQISNTIQIAANTIIFVLNGLGGAVNHVLDRLKVYLDYLSTHGRDVLLEILSLMEQAIKLMSFKLWMDTFNALLKLELAYPWANAMGYGEEIKVQMDFLKEAMREIPATAASFGRELRRMRPWVENNFPQAPNGTETGTAANGANGPQASLPPGMGPGASSQRTADSGVRTTNVALQLNLTDELTKVVQVALTEDRRTGMVTATLAGEYA